MKKQLGIAIVGCGLISRFHLKALQEIESYRVTGIWDILPEAADKVAQDYKVGTFATLEALLLDPDTDVVDICLPSGLHAEYGCLATAAGKHVIVEKPIDISIEAAQKLLNSAASHGVYVAEILQNRFSSSVKKN